MTLHNTHAETRNAYRLRMAGLMLFADFSALLTAVILSTYFFKIIIPSIPINLFKIEYLVFFTSCLSLFMASKLYPGIGINPANEIKLISQYTSISFIFGTGISILLNQDSRSISLLMLTWVSSLILMTGFRWLIRILAVQMNLWKEPVLIVARGEQAAYLSQYFHKRLRLGFEPAVVAADKAFVPQFGEILISLQELPSYSENFSAWGIRTAIIDLSAADIFAGGNRQKFPSSISDFIFVSDLSWLEGASLDIHDFEGILGVETRKNVLSTSGILVKNSMDFSFSLLGSLLLLPFFALIAVIIKFDSPGSVFYTQKRVGKGGQRINIIKFRTMVQNAEEKLHAYLAANPSAKVEWDETQKLKKDPRITRPGQWLRKFSIDELPQIINVLKGEMSLVGPRPILPEQVELYGERIDVYYGTKPGISGLWQVSGRNSVSFQERTRFDIYYVRNWSIWLDIYILLRTVWVVLFHKGAY